MTASRLRLLAVGAAAISLLGALFTGIGVGIATGSWLVGLLIILGTGFLVGGVLLALGTVLVSLRGLQRAAASATREIAAIRKDVSRVMWRTEPVRATAGSVGRVREQLDLLLKPTSENRRRFAAVSRGEVRRVLQRDPVGYPEVDTRNEGTPITATLPDRGIGLVLGTTVTLSTETRRPFVVLTPEGGTLPDGATAMVVDESALYTGPWAESADGPARMVKLARAARAAGVPVLLLAVHGGEHTERSFLREQVDGIIDGNTWVREPGQSGGEQIRQALLALAPLGITLPLDK